ncbi:MAG: gliding motility-associated C-terminal domain-containing protein [Saprospiraceae bacterium]|nr:gliding motility-associated C-terminal domain-containing protein [Saprospiraceae bacterium]
MRYLIRRWPLCCFLLFLLSFSRLNGQVFFLRDTFCSNQLLLVNNHLYGPDNPTGTEVLPGAAANGADSIIEVRLVFRQPSMVLLSPTLCPSDTIWVNGVPYHAKFRLGQEIIEGGAANGCDSIIAVDLQFRDSAVLHLEQVICGTDSLVVNGITYNAANPSGLQTIPAGGSAGCDSLIFVQLAVVQSTYREIRDTICPDTFLLINGHRYDRQKPSGTEIFPSTLVAGCDSVVFIQLAFRDLSVDLGADLSLSAGDSACISPTLSFQPTATWWSPTLPCGQPDCPEFCQVFFSSEIVQFFATDVFGCTTSDQLRVSVKSVPPVYAPNAFKPGSAFPNNYFFLSAGPGISRIKSLRIADRWGEQVFQQDNLDPDVPTQGWDGTWKGKTALPGVYVYWAELEWWDAHTEIISGSVTLIQ